MALRFTIAVHSSATINPTEIAREAQRKTIIKIASNHHQNCFQSFTFQRLPPHSLIEPMSPFSLIVRSSGETLVTNWLPLPTTIYIVKAATVLLFIDWLYSLR